MYYLGMKKLERYKIQQLTEWMNKSLRKPLILLGARQVGKSFLLKTFGEKYFKNVFYCDFFRDESLHLIFEKDRSPERIIQDLELHFNKKIFIENDLIIFDEIQFCPRALSSLKYFAQDYPKSFIASAGSLLGVYLDNNEGFPVGKVETIYLYPMSFEEYLMARGEEQLAKIIQKTSCENPPSSFSHQKLLDKMLEYFVVGGLPEVVSIFLENQSHAVEAYEKVRKLQLELINNYKADIAKHSGKIKAVKIESVFKSIPLQLAKSVNQSKFVFKDVLRGVSNYEQIEAPLEWLIKAGLVIKVPIIDKAEFPLEAFAQNNRFKLYLFDVGLLGAMLDLPAKIILDSCYGQFKGYFAENFVLQELKSHLNCPIYNWQKGKAEVDFVMGYDDSILPIEVKAGLNLKAKSLKIFCETYSPKTSILFSIEALRSETKKILLPLYLVSILKNKTSINTNKSLE